MILRMRLLDRYLLRELLVPLAYCLGGFLIFYVAFDLIFGIKGFQEKHLNAADLAEYYVVTLPELLVAQVIPVSLLLALLYVLTNHNRHNELTAMRAAGVSLGRLSMPYLCVGVFLGLVVLAMNELLVPQSAEKARDILRRHQPHPENHAFPSKLVFYNQGRQWEVSGFNPVTTEMTAPNIQWELPNGSHRYISADRGIYAQGRWFFYHAIEWDGSSPAGPSFSDTHASNAVLALTLSETPAWVKIAIKVAAVNPVEAARKPQLSISEILGYLRPNPRLNPALRATLLTQLQCRLAEPFTCLAVVLIALPFGARAGRHNVFAGVASSVFICFAYFIMQRISMGLGVGGKLPPVLAAWLPNLVFGMTGLALLWRAR
jgi:lipopolysaccharide export system permease protein